VAESVIQLSNTIAPMPRIIIADCSICDRKTAAQTIFVRGAYLRGVRSRL